VCGIFGIISGQEQALGSILIEAGKRLAYRGYDSVGCATVAGDGEIDLRKGVGRIDDVSAALDFPAMRGWRGITQLRWATFGAPSYENAQPHLDSDGDMVGAHNGNVVNNVQMRERFIREGLTVRGTNDGETCVHAVERYFDRNGRDMVAAIHAAYDDLEGDYAFVITHRDEQRLYAIKKGSGLGDGFTCVSSDLPSILPLTRQVLYIRDGEIVVLSAGGVELYGVHDGARIEREINAPRPRVALPAILCYNRQKQGIPVLLWPLAVALGEQGPPSPDRARLVFPSVERGGDVRRQTPPEIPISGYDRPTDRAWIVRPTARHAPGQDTGHLSVHNPKK
jgi:glucosamine 6-phosphate synthetase-like amidotransferase/phosphosugar isomerase protein